MQQPLASVNAVRLENFEYKDWLAPLQQSLLSHYPARQLLYLNPSVVLVVLNTTQQWDKDDIAFFASLRTQAFFSAENRWTQFRRGPKPTSPSMRILAIGSAQECA